MNRIALLRKHLGLSQKELGIRIGVAQNTICNWENEKREPDRASLKKLTSLFHCSADYLLGLAERPGPDLTFAEFPDDAPPEYQEAVQRFVAANPGRARIEGQEKAPSVSDEAMKIAEDYQGLDKWGRQVVRSVIADEQSRMEDEARFLADTAPEEEPKVINLFLEPSAAGFAAPTLGRDYEPYTLGPDDPPGAAYAVRIKGDSMEPYFPDGSIAFVNHDALRDGEVGIFCVDGGTVCKQYHKEGPVVYLFSLNRKRQDADVVLFPGSNRPFFCQGRVMGQRRYPVPGR